MSVYVISATGASGRRFQFNGIPRDENHARTRAARAASLLSRSNSPEWAGGRVVVHDATSRKLVAVVRVTAGKEVRS